MKAAFCGSMRLTLVLIALIFHCAFIIQTRAQDGLVVGQNAPIVGDPTFNSAATGSDGREVVNGNSAIVGDAGSNDNSGREVVVESPSDQPSPNTSNPQPAFVAGSTPDMTPPSDAAPSPAPAPAPAPAPPTADTANADGSNASQASTAASSASAAPTSTASSSSAAAKPTSNSQPGARLGKETVFNNIVQGSSAQTSSSGDTASSLSPGAVFGIVVAGIVGLAVVFMFVKRVLSGGSKPNPQQKQNMEDATTAFSTAATAFPAAAAKKNGNQTKTVPLQGVQISDPLGASRRGSVALKLYANNHPTAKKVPIHPNASLPTMPVVAAANSRMHSLAMDDPMDARAPLGGVGRPMLMSPSIVAINKYQGRQEVQKRQQQPPPAPMPAPIASTSMAPPPVRQPVFKLPPVQKTLIPDKPHNPEFTYNRNVDPILDGPTYKQANRVSMRRLSLSSEVGSLVTSVSRNPPKDDRAPPMPRGPPAPVPGGPSKLLKPSVSQPQLHSPRAERPVSRVVVTKTQMAASRVMSKPSSGLNLIDKLEKASSTPDLPSQLLAYEASKQPQALEPYRGERHSEESSVYSGRRPEMDEYHQRRSEDLKPVRKPYAPYDTEHYPLSIAPKPKLAASNPAAFATFSARPNILTSAMQEAKAALMQPAYTADSSSLADLSPTAFNRNLYPESTAAPPSTMGLRHMTSSSSLPSTTATDRHEDARISTALPISKEMRDILGQYLLGDGTDILSTNGNESVAGATSAMSDVASVSGSVVAQRPSPPPMPNPPARLDRLQEVDNESMVSSDPGMLGGGLMPGKRVVVDSVSAMSEDDASSRF